MVADNTVPAVTNDALPPPAKSHSEESSQEGQAPKKRPSKKHEPDEEHKPLGGKGEDGDDDRDDPSNPGDLSGLDDLLNMDGDEPKKRPAAKGRGGQSMKRPAKRHEEVGLQ